MMKKNAFALLFALLLLFLPLTSRAEGCIIDPIPAPEKIFTASQECIVIPEGTPISYNGHKGSSESEREWRRSSSSKDRLWKYEAYHPKNHQYYNLNITSGSSFGLYGVGTDPSSSLEVSDYGSIFTPYAKIDVSKSFFCPEDGTVTVKTTVARTQAVKEGETPATFAIFRNDQKVYPETEDALLLSDTKTHEIEFSLTVRKGQRLAFRIGADGNDTNDSVAMENFITYDKDVRLEHLWGKEYEEIAPSCIVEGVLRKDCEICGAFATCNLGKSAHKRSVQSTVVKEPTETEQGILEYECIVCKEKMPRAIPKLTPLVPEADSKSLLLGLGIGISGGVLAGGILGTLLTLCKKKSEKGNR